MNLVLANLRAKGWLVASHNDYMVDATGQRRTYWMLTHPSGRWIDGDGATDLEALSECTGKIGAPSVKQPVFRAT